MFAGSDKINVDIFSFKSIQFLSFDCDNIIER
jgi:hypothetical protein